ncbi:MAG: PilT/PilU family type 4a pilus ATPase [Candidatus Omnitrophota bacterium]
MVKIKEIFKQMVEKEASDLFLRAGATIRMRARNEVAPIDDYILTKEDIDHIVADLTTSSQRDQFQMRMDLDFAVYEETMGRFRVSIFVQRGSPSLVIRHIRKDVRNFEELNLPAKILEKLSLEKRGIVLLTGAAGSGKSTTIATMIEYMNNNVYRHILTVEEPIEFTFTDKKCIINQRELGLDVRSYAFALKHFTYQSPDVIFIGNIRDLDTMFASVNAAETGVLVLSTIHTVNAAQTIERIINFFAPHQHEEIRAQLSMLLKGVISLRLIPRKDGKGSIPAYEVMLLTPTIARLIREGKIWEIPAFIEQGQIFGMQSFKQSLVSLVKDGKVDAEVARDFSDSADEFELELKGIKRL